ncbi:MAG: hypothetical protein ABIJ97_14725, partial [Bacteroidota bacterium]
CTYPGGIEFTKTIPKNEGTISDNVLYEKLLVGKDKFLFFYRGWSKDAKKSSWLVRSCTLSGEYTKDAKELDSHIAQNRMKAGDYDIAISPNQELFAVLMSLPYEKDTKQKIRIKIFDANTLVEKWSKDITMDIESEKGHNNSIALDDNGNIYIIKKVAEGNQFKFHYYSANSTSATLKEIPLTIPEGTLIDQYKVLMTTKSNLYFTGLYSAKSSVAVDGSFCIKINTGTQQIDISKFNIFSDRIAGEKSGLSLQNIEMKDILFMSSGSFQIIAEYHKETISQKTDQTGKTLYDGEIQSNRVLLMCYKSDGTRDWEATINKNQSFKTTEKNPAVRWDSFAYGFVNDNLYIIYNNMNLQSKWIETNGAEKNKINFSNASYCPFMYVVEPNGNIKFGDKVYGLPLYKMYESCSISGACLVPWFGVSLGSGLIIIGSSTDAKKSQFGKIVLN